MSPHSRDYDVILFGATGFTGRLTAFYLAEKQNKEPFRWALGGRNLEKLRALRTELAALFPSASAIEVLAMDSSDPASLRLAAARARVLLTTVGPYAEYGEPLVAACLAEGTDYVDITGEGPFVQAMVERYDAEAKRQKLRIVSCCGFDSIPADLGAWFTVQQLPPEAPKEISCFVSVQNRSPLQKRFHSVSGGTWHSAIGFMRLPELFRQVRAHVMIGQAAPGRSVRPFLPRLRYRSKDQVWGVPMPLIDVEVVLRSATMLKNYGPSFRYGHFAQIGSLPVLLGGALGVGAVFTLAQFPLTRDWLLSLRPRGEGPSAEERAQNSFCLRFVGVSPSARVITEVRGGDPGYGDTSKMVSEAALCLALDRERLPPHFGVISPAFAMADCLLPRLRQAGLRFEVIEPPA